MTNATHFIIQYAGEHTGINNTDCLIISSINSIISAVKSPLKITAIFKIKHK